MPDNGASGNEFREGMIALTMKQRGCDRAEAEVIIARIADRLDGYTHAEVKRMHPLPDERNAR